MFVSVRGELAPPVEPAATARDSSGLRCLGSVATAAACGSRAVTMIEQLPIRLDLVDQVEQ